MNQEHMMRINKLVLDNNIWISYLITGREQRLIDIIGNNNLTVFSCDELSGRNEVCFEFPSFEKVQYKCSICFTDIKKCYGSLQADLPFEKLYTGAPADNYLIALPLQTYSGLITSGDGHILSEKKNLEKKYTKLKIITMAEFEQMFP